LPERIAYARRPKTLPVILSPEEVATFLEAVPSRKDRVALITAYATGLRASEVTGLRIQDIDISRMVIHVANGKGGKQRYVMLSPKLLGILRAYWAIERPRPWLFPGRGGEKPLDPSTLNAACAAAVAATGISKHATLHSLRHAFATHLVEQGVDVTIMQALLGHSHLSTTIRYISVATRTITGVKSPLEHLKLTVPETRLQPELRPSG
jgi:integrase